MDRENRLKRLSFRAWHRGTREADMMIGGFFNNRSADWDDADIEWFDRLLENDDVDIMAWVIGTLQAPEDFQGEMMRSMQKLDYIDIPKSLQ